MNVRLGRFSVSPIVLIGGLIVVLLVAAAFYTLLPEERQPNAEYQAMVEKIALVTSYTQEVTTETDVGERHLKIEGVYHIDGPVARFASRATTTLSIPNDGEHAFTLENISIGSSVYSRLTTDSPLLRESIPQSPDWQQFDANAIPERWKDIAINGPTVDVLLLFRDNGSYLQEISDPDENPRTFLFTVSENAPRGAGGTLEMLLQRIGSGTVRVTIDEFGMLEAVEISSGTYSSSIRISNINSVPPIEVPIPASDGATL